MFSIAYTLLYKFVRKRLQQNGQIITDVRLLKCDIISMHVIVDDPGEEVFSASVAWNLKW